MSKAESKNPTRAARKAEARERRAARQEARAAQVRAIQAWHKDKAAAAQKRAGILAQKWRSGSRGVNRVPRVPVPAITIKPHLVGKSGVPISSELGTSRLPDGRSIQADYRTRRAMGARGHQRRPRRRELPGAMERRVERNRKTWTA